MRMANITGPCFVSIGDSEKLKIFLDKNPKIDPAYMLVDDYSFAAYNAAGLGKLFDNPDLTIKGSKNMQKPNFSTLMSYLPVAGALAPIPKDLKFWQIPEGVTRLGGTFGFKGNDIIYSYEDGVPGDYPNPEEILKLFENQ